MAGLRRLDRNLGRLQVADFADHDDVRILSQERAQRCGEGHAALVVLLHLVDAGQADFHRVFGGGNVARLVVEDAQRGIQRNGLARTGGAGHQHHAVRLVDRIQEQLLLVRLVAQFVDAQLGRAAIQDTQHHLFTEQGRQRADAEIDLLGLGQVELDAPVLRHALFGDVQLCHHLQARGNALVQLHRRARHHLQQAVDAQAHAVIVFVGLEVDVRCALADRVDQHLVDELHHRGVVTLGVDAGVGARAFVVAQADIEVGHALVVAAQRVADGVMAGVPLFQRAADLVLIDQDRLHHQVGMELDLVQRMGRIAGTHEQLAAAFEQRQHVVLAQQLLADQAHGVLAGVERGHVEQRHAELDRVGGGELRGTDQLVLREPSGQRLACRSGLGHRIAGGGLVQSAVLDQAAGQAGDADEVGGGYGIHRKLLLPSAGYRTPRAWNTCNRIQQPDHAGRQAAGT